MAAAQQEQPISRKAWPTKVHMYSASQVSCDLWYRPNGLLERNGVGPGWKCQVSVCRCEARTAERLCWRKDGERCKSAGGSQSQKSSPFAFHRTAGFLRDLWASNTLAKNLHLHCAVAAAADPRAVRGRRRKWRCDIAVRVDGWDRRG